MSAVRFGVAPRVVPSAQIVDIVHASLCFDRVWFAEPVMSCRVWIAVDGRPFVPAHVDGLTIPDGQATFTETRFQLERGDDPLTMPIAVRLAGQPQPFIYDRALNRGEPFALSVGPHEVVVRIRHGGRELRQNFVVIVPTEGPLVLTMTTRSLINRLLRSER